MPTDKLLTIEGRRMVLTSITLSGTMLGTYWGSLLAAPGEDGGQELDFSQDFLIEREGEAHSPWATYWQDIRESLIEALSSGDLVGQMGELIEGEIAFHYAGERASYVTSQPLKPGRYTRDLFHAS